jgi:hypothetical protein
MTTRSSTPCHCVFFLIQMLEVLRATLTRSLASCHHAFFCSSVASPKDTMENWARQFHLIDLMWLGSLQWSFSP